MATQPTFSERVRALGIAPLVKSHDSTFTDWYTFGLGRCLFSERTGDGPYDDASLLTTFQQCRKLGYFGSQHDLSRTIGLALGMMHGGVILPDGTTRNDRTTLVTLTSRDALRGYQAGRDFFFLDADEEDEWHMSDDRLFEWLRDLAEEYAGYEDAVRTVRFHIGCIFGELSGHLFPWTPQEQHVHEAESIRLLGCVGKFKPQSIAARQFALQAVS